jgi:hypothetical protein
MSITTGCSIGTYSALQDRALGPDGTELRNSIEAAIAPPRPPRTLELLEKIGAALRKGKETEGVMVAVEPFGRMVELLTVLPADIPLPNLVVESESEIGLDWELNARRVLTVTVNPTPFIGYAALLGHEPVYGRVPFAGQIPETVAFLLRRVYQESPKAD